MEAVPKPKEWSDLRELVKKQLSAKKKTRTLAEFNKLTIIRNFCTLRLKGHGWGSASREIAQQWHEGEGVHFARMVCLLVRFYRRFEALPVERRGGLRASRSLFCDETVQGISRDWLGTQKIGSVTPLKFCKALNDTLFPKLGIVVPNPICERTARRWLIKLGYRRTVYRKGVYVDGHERPDVVKFRNETFLPKMAQYEAKMTHYEMQDGVLTAVPPTLAPGEKEIVAHFHDECAFHAFDFVNSIW